MITTTITVITTIIMMIWTNSSSAKTKKRKRKKKVSHNVIHQWTTQKHSVFHQNWCCPPCKVLQRKWHPIKYEMFHSLALLINQYEWLQVRSTLRNFSVILRRFLYRNKFFSMNNSVGQQRTKLILRATCDTSRGQKSWREDSGHCT